MTDLATTELTADEARALTDEIRGDLANFLPKVKRAFEGRADKALGYDSWQEYSAAELNNVRIPLGERADAVLELRQAGMSTRAIGSALGVSEGTVRNDLSSAQNYAVEQPAKVTSLDGRDRPAQRPTHAPEPAAPHPEADPLAAWSDEERDLRKRLGEGQTIVVSLRANHTNLVQWASDEGLLVRVDRRTEWGNPFEMPGDGTRLEVINSYRMHYMPRKFSLLERVGELKGKALACWCAPEACHAEVLAAWAEAEAGEYS